jgi:peroxiredoxin family protein
MKHCGLCSGVEEDREAGRMSSNLQEPETGLLGEQTQALNAWFDKRFAEKMAEREERVIPSMSIMVTKGTLDWAYPPFILGSTASALGWDVTLFFTFYGLSLLKKELDLSISPLGNPAMPMKMPFGPERFRSIEWNMPNLVMTAVPGFETMATAMMKKTLKDKGVAPIAELREICVESGVKLIACQMTVDLFGWPKDAFIPEISDWAGAATYLTIAQKAQVNLYT